VLLVRAPAHPPTAEVTPREPGAEAHPARADPGHRGTEKAFWRLPGVASTAVGYIGGYTENPSYEEVCSGRTGHTEAVQVVFDQDKVSFTDLLRLHWQSHDPTQGMGQGNDRGSQYRSGIYTTHPEHTTIAEASKGAYEKALQAAAKGKGELITTEIKEGARFFYAEDYHQQYLAKPKARQYCSAQPTEVPLPDFATWAPEGTLDKYAPKLPEAFWAEHGPKPYCTIKGPNAQIVWPPA